MEIFCFSGYQNNRIKMELLDAFGFPEAKSYEGGYDIICRLLIDIESYHISFDKLFSATGALYRFSDELQNCYDRLEGKAEYKLLLEQDLYFAVEMTQNGHAVITGRFQERPDMENIFMFQMETDQTCFPAVFRGIANLKNTYGDAIEIKKRP